MPTLVDTLLSKYSLHIWSLSSKLTSLMKLCAHNRHINPISSSLYSIIIFRTIPEETKKHTKKATNVKRFNSNFVCFEVYLRKLSVHQNSRLYLRWSYTVAESMIRSIITEGRLGDCRFLISHWIIPTYSR